MLFEYNWQVILKYSHTLWQVHYTHTNPGDEVWHAVVPD